MPTQDETVEQRRRTKERHSKVRTGCLTCKQRHVKCDERKPAPCLRCTKGGYKCAGYVEPPKPWLFEYGKSSNRKKEEIVLDSVASTETFSGERSILTEFFEIDPSTLSQVSNSSATRREQSITVAQAVSQIQALSQMKPRGPYKTPEEQRAFKHFMEVCIPIATMYSDATTWSVSIPQAAWSHPAIKHSLIAVALVNETMSIERRRPKYGHNSKALYHVNCAIRALTQNVPPTEVVIAAGLLLQFMESINNNAQIAHIHLMSAVRICEEFKQKVARGEHVNGEQADLILNHLDPTLQVAVKFGELVLKQNLTNEQVIDQWTPEAFELKESLATTARPGAVDSFRGVVDSRNNWGAAAVKLTKLRSNLRPHPTSSAHLSTPPQSSSSSAIELEKEIRAVEKVFDHCTRLHRPLHDENDVESCMLNVHDQVLRCILKDTVHLQDAIQVSTEGTSNDELLERALYLVYSGKAHEVEDLTIELGIIPPLFYLATRINRCNEPLRRRATVCLQELLADRSEGAWTGYVAGRIASEIIDLEDLTVIDEIVISTADHQLELLDKCGKELAFSTTSMQSVGPEHACGLQLWLTYALNTTKSTRKTDHRDRIGLLPERRQMRKRLSWTSYEIAMLPRQINTIIRDYGYQGYFSDATDELDPDNASVPRIGQNGGLTSR